jgi:hypothetical protein
LKKPLLLLVNSHHGNLLIGLILFLQTLEVFDALNLALQLQRLRLLLFFLNALHQDCVQLLLSSLLIALSSGFVIQLPIPALLLVNNLLDLLALLQLLALVEVPHLQLQQVRVLILLVVLLILLQNLLLDLSGKLKIINRPTSAARCSTSSSVPSTATAPALAPS